MIEAVEETEERNHRASKPEPVVVTELPVIFINLWSYSLCTREQWGQHSQVTALIASKQFIKKDCARLCVLYKGYDLRLSVFCSRRTELLSVADRWHYLSDGVDIYILSHIQVHFFSHWVYVMWCHKNLWITVLRTECRAMQWCAVLCSDVQCCAVLSLGHSGNLANKLLLRKFELILQNSILEVLPRRSANLRPTFNLLLSYILLSYFFPLFSLSFVFFILFIYYFHCLFISML
jgi:hypothetical protein